MTINGISSTYGFPCLDPACKVRIQPRDRNDLASLKEAREIRDAHVAEIHPEIRRGAELLTRAEYQRRKMAVVRARKGRYVDDEGA